MKSNITLGIISACSILMMSLLAACGGGGGGGSSGGITTPLSGAVVDGYITGATVCLDLNSNGKCDPGEPTTTTRANGSYSFNVSASISLGNLNVVAEIPVGAVDSDNPGTPIPSAYTLLASASQPLVVSPLTTLVSEYVAANPSMSAQTAATQVVMALGLPAGTNIFQDYVAANNTAVHNVAQVVNAVIQNSNLGTAPTTASLNAAVAVAATYVPTATVATGSISTILSTATVAAARASGSLVNTAPIPTYTSDNLNLYAELNAIRQNAGAGLLVQNTLLDTAAASHANYLISNNLVSNVSYLNSTISVSGVGVLGGHYEDPSMTGYTGSTPLSRATAAGYSGTTIGELLSVGSVSGAVCGASIEDSAYHLIEIISPFMYIGLSYNTGTAGNNSVCDIELGIPAASGQYSPSGSWVFYPANAQSGVPPTFYNQSESPVPAPDLQLAGHPIVMSLYNQTNTSLNASDVVLSTFSLTTSGGSPVSARVLAQSGVTSTGTALTTDANIPVPGVLILLPTSPLSANTTYTVTFSATVKGTVVSKSWSFTTGSMN